MVYSDFCEAFTPRDQYYMTVLANKHAQYLHQNIPKRHYFTNETRQCFFDCLRVHFESEESIELLKKRLSRRPGFNIRETFKYLDQSSEGLIYRDDLNKVMQDNKIYMTDQELDLLHCRFDKNRNGRITF